MIKCRNKPGDNDSEYYEISLPSYGGGLPEEWLVWKDKLLKVLDGQSISTVPLRYSFSERLLTDDIKATLNQTALDIGICTVEFSTKYFWKCSNKHFQHMISANRIGIYVGT